MASAVSRYWSTWLWILSAGSVEPDEDRWGTSWRPSGFNVMLLPLLAHCTWRKSSRERLRVDDLHHMRHCDDACFLLKTEKRFFFYFHPIQKVIMSSDKIYLCNEGRCTERKRWSAATIHSLNSNSKVEVFHFFIRPLASQIINLCWFMPTPK